MASTACLLYQHSPRLPQSKEDHAHAMLQHACGSAFDVHFLCHCIPFFEQLWALQAQIGFTPIKEGVPQATGTMPGELLQALQSHAGPHGHSGQYD